MSDKAKTITIVCEWRSVCHVEVPEDWEEPSSLSGFGDDILEQMDTTGAELVNWTVQRPKGRKP